MATFWVLITADIAHPVYKDSVHTAHKAMYASTILLTVT